MRVYLVLLTVILPSLAFGDCVQLEDPRRPANSILPAAQTCSDNITSDGRTPSFQRSIAVKCFTAAQLNNADIQTDSIGYKLFACCSNCGQCNPGVCVSTGSLATGSLPGQIACITGNNPCR